MGTVINKPPDISTDDPQPLRIAAEDSGELSIPACYSTETKIDGNVYRQLLIPADDATLVVKSGVRFLNSKTGNRHRILKIRSSVKETERALLVPSAVDLDAVRDLAEAKGTKWIGYLSPRDPEEVLQSLKQGFRFQADDPESSIKGLRDPQLGAVHAVLGYWTTRAATPATVVMPTGTGKTETMLALFAASRPKRLLVLVPSDALRDQIAEKFETFGVLQEFGVVPPDALRPVVGRIKHGLQSVLSAKGFAIGCNVVISTPSALSASTAEAKTAFFAEFSHLFIDEAHHVPASTWHAVRDEFADRPIVQFTATPYREDGRHLGGRLIYAFPLREAQRQKYYSKINYISIYELEERDQAIAKVAVEQLRSDLKSGYDHLLMARVKWITRAQDVIGIYEKMAPEFKPVIVHSKASRKERDAAIAAIKSRDSRIIVCVDMLGEGFDLAPLKVAAIHDAHKSIAVTLQFVGRFARVKDAIGDATVVVGRPDLAYDNTLRRLYAEDADWNLLISDISEKTIGAQEEISEFEAGFTVKPDEVSIRNLLPKMSTVVYRSDSSSCNFDGIQSVFPEDRLLTWPVAINPREGVAWFVTEERTGVRWGDIKTVDEVVYHLYVLYWDADHRLLYINSSNNDSLHEELAKAVAGESAKRIKGEDVFRSMSGVKRLVPTNVGVLDIRNRARRFSMYVGADVSAGFPRAEAQTKTKTNIFAFGFEEGVRTSIGASQKGRVWSYRVAGSLKDWVDWCNKIGTKLLDSTINIDNVMADFIKPVVLDSRPSLVPLALEWPPELFFNASEELKVEISGDASALVDVELTLTGHSATGPIPFAVTSPNKSLEYELDIHDGAMQFRPIGQEAFVLTRQTRMRLSEFLAKSELIVYLEQDAMIVPHCMLLKPDRELAAYDPNSLKTIDWTGINPRRESQGVGRDQTSIQARMIKYLTQSKNWDVIMDDDGPREIADIVALRIDNDELFVQLVHCKFSSEDKPGARVEDLYAVCGQAQKSIAWTGNVDHLFRQLIRRERNRRRRGCPSGIIHGTERTLYEIQDKAHGMRTHFSIGVAQPGLSGSKVSGPILQLLATTEVYLNETALAEFDVYCSS